MSAPAEAVEESWLPLEDALDLFEVTRAELLAACKSGNIRHVYVAENDENAARMHLGDLRKHFKELVKPEETNKRSHIGVLKWVGAVAAAKLVGSAADEALQFLNEFVFRRSIPARNSQISGQANAPVYRPAPSRPPATQDRAMRPGQNYITREVGGHRPSRNPGLGRRG